MVQRTAQKPSLDTVIKQAREQKSPGVITEAEAESIIKRAGRLSNREAIKLGDLFDHRTRFARGPVPPRHPPALGNPQHPYFDEGAVQKFNQLFITRDLPYGDNADGMRERINDFLGEESLGRPLETAPRISHLPVLDLQPGLTDAPHRSARVDVTKKHFWLVQSPGGNTPRPLPGNVTKVWGPFPLPKAQPSLEAQIRAARANGFISVDEARSLTKGPFTNAEATLLGQLWDSRLIDDHAHIPPALGNPLTPAFDDAALPIFEKAFRKHDLPFGEHADVLRRRIDAALERVRLTEGSLERPQGTEGWVVLDMSPGLLDAPHRYALIDVNKPRDRQYVLMRSAGGNRPHVAGTVPDNRDRFWGPWDLPSTVR